MLFAHPVLLVLLLVRPVGGGGGGSLLCRCGCTSRQRQQHLLQPLLPLHHCYKCGARFLTTQYPPRPFVSGYHYVVGSRVMAKDRCSSPHTGQRGSLSGHFALSVRHHEALPRLSFCAPLHGLVGLCRASPNIFTSKLHYLHCQGISEPTGCRPVARIWRVFWEGLGRCSLGSGIGPKARRSYALRARVDFLVIPIWIMIAVL